MWDRSTQGKWGFLFDAAWESIIAMICYKNILFRSLPNTTYTASMIILWGLTAGFVLMGTFVLYRFWRTGWTAVLTAIFPFGLYTIAAYKNTIEKFIILVLSVVVIVTVIFMIILLKTTLKAQKRFKYMKNLRGDCLYKAFIGMQVFAGIGFLVIIGTLGIGGVFGNGILKTTVQATTGNTAQAQTIKNNIETLKLLQVEQWNKITTQQKLDVISTVANIEAYYLGLPNELNVELANLSEDVLGGYLDDTHTILIDLEHLENDPVDEVLETCCHEAYHSYEYRLIEAYQSTDDNLKSLRIYKRAISYAEEFSDYADDYAEDFENFCLYYYQECESDAREYAEGAVFDYGEKIQKYLNEIEIIY